MVVFDSNIFIYGGRGQLDLSQLQGLEVCYASITFIEALGFPHITSAEQRKLIQLLDAYQMVPLSRPIIERAVTLRQDKKMSLGDAIVAATALELNAELWTANDRDFRHIEDLRLRNPLAR